MITLTDEHDEIVLADVLSEDLVFQYNVEDLFRAFNRSKFTKFIIDFSRTESISRSFAHQYLICKKQSEIQIIERNIPPDIQQMFDYVRRTSPSLK